LLSLSGDFTRSLGTGSNQVQWTGSGGFYASSYASYYTINIGGLATPSTLTWGQGGFVPSGSALVLDGSFNFENSINLGTDASATRQIDVQNTRFPGLTTGALTGSGNLFFQAYGTNGTGQRHQVDLENSVAITGTLELSNVTAWVGIYNQTSGFIDVANIHLTNGALLGEFATNGQSLRVGVNLTLDNGSVYGIAAGLGGSNLAIQTLGQLNSTDATTQVSLGAASSNGTTTVVSPATLTVNSGYFAGVISDSVGYFVGPITDPGVGGAMIKTGTGILTLAGNSNIYTAGTTIQQGTLFAGNTSGSATGTGAVTVKSGGSLGGTGIIAPTGTNNVVVQSGGKVDLSAFDPAHPPAFPTGTLTFSLASTNSVTFQAGASLVFDLGAGGTSDELTFTGLTKGKSQIFLNDNQVNLNFLAGAGPGTYTLFSFDQSSAYSGILLNGADYTFNYNPTDITVTIVPEPGAWSLMVCGVLFVLLSRFGPLKSIGQVKNGTKNA
jgi:autotransporter-associated beta strand protein